MEPEEAGFGLTFERAERLLKKGELREARGMLPWGSNYTLLMEIVDEEIDALAVYKPRRGERPLWDFPDGTLYKREFAAYEISQMLAWSIVPPTVIRDGPYGIGMVQLFIPHDPDQHYFTFSSEQKEQLRSFVLFDYIINNADRKGGHCLVGTDGGIWGIDHGICFHAQYKLRTVIWDFAGEPIEAPLLESLIGLCEHIEPDSPGCQQLARLLSSSEINALKRRINNLVDAGTYPEAGLGRSYPWPPV